jgi:uncharacterized protein (TIGR03435 family)
MSKLKLLTLLATFSMASLLNAAPPQKPTFEVASIKPDKSGDRRAGIMNSPGGRFTVKNVPLRMLIRIAYKIDDSQIIGGPAWINSERWDIEAEASSSPHEDLAKMSEAQREAFMEQQRLRLQSLLEDRFQLKIHREKRERPVYALVIAKGGPKLKESTAVPGGPQTGPSGLKPRQMRMSMSRGQVTAYGVPVSALAEQLSNQLGRPVLDETGLKGNYDFTLQWTPDESQGQMFRVPEEGQQAGGNPPPPEAVGPSVFTAIQEQLGLRLKPEKGPVDVLVIDHVEQPTEN